jgi:hypothetical protein
MAQQLRSPSPKCCPLTDPPAHLPSESANASIAAFNETFIQAFKTTHAFKLWDKHTDRYEHAVYYFCKVTD